MKDDFLTFQKFNDEGLAKEFIERLQKLNIPFEIDDTQNFFDPSFANNPVNREISIKLKPEYFETAQKELEKYYKEQVDSVDKDYYLFDFSDQELTEIIMKPDEWGHFDYQLAQKILKDRGKEINTDVVELIRKQRNDDLAMPETSNRYIVVLGYVSAFLGGIIGILIGWHLSYSKKTLPDGRRVYRYRENERDYGTRILLIAGVCLILWMFVRWYLLSKN